MRVKAGYTVEAALLCPFLCLMLCGMIVMTLTLYHRVEEYASKLEGETNRPAYTIELIRIEAVAEEFLLEVTKDAGGV